MKTYQHFIDGAYADPAGGEWFDSVDPYRGEVWAKMPRGTEADVDRAVTELVDILATKAWDRPEFKTRAAVT